MFADVIVDITHEKLDRVFEYKVPAAMESEICVGALVSVPFGNGNRMVNAYVVELKEKPEFDEKKIKELAFIVDTKVKYKSNVVKLAAFIKTNYGGTLNQALKIVVPVKKEISKVKKQQIRLKVDERALSEAIYDANKKKALARLRLLEALKDNNIIPYEIVKTKLNISMNTITPLVKMGIIAVDDLEYYRNPIKNIERHEREITLTDEQDYVVKSINTDLVNDINNTYLIHGITGSGKTEVYIEIIRQVLKLGKDVIVLIPEIALTYQTVKRFYNTFGDLVSIINSKLSAGERYDQMMRAQNGDVRIMIGPRSALFTPFANLGLIIIDEEHELSYKSESQPRYHARDVAIELSRLNKASVILGSATPSLDAYYRAKKGEFKLFNLKSRVGSSILPDVEVVDMRKELELGNRSIFSAKLKSLMEDRIKKREQVMLFLNRRGYSNFVSCRKCGEVMMCPHCDVSLKFHNNNTLVCHYCGIKMPSPKICPKCSSKYIGTFGIGTQKVEEAVKRLYPNLRVLRMDYDTTSKRDDYDKILSTFAAHEADVLIGTQMIVKGHDFPLVTLVGILAADLSLYANDYMATERTFELLTQAAGRAGRGANKGICVIQTYSPDNYSVEYAAKQDYEGFYEKEILFRKKLEYPPVSNMLLVKISSANEEKCYNCAKELANYLKGIKVDTSRVIGPINAYIYKMSDIFTNMVYIKECGYNTLTKYKDLIEEYVRENKDFYDVSVQFDFNPLNM